MHGNLFTAEVINLNNLKGSANINDSVLRPLMIWSLPPIVTFQGPIKSTVIPDQGMADEELLPDLLNQDIYNADKRRKLRCVI
jgi:hypothetical protein